MLLSTYLKDKYNYFRLEKCCSQNCGYDSRIVNFVEFDCNNNEINSFNVYVSKDLNKVLNRSRGFNLSRSNNSGVCLYQKNIDLFIYYDPINKHYQSF